MTARSDVVPRRAAQSFRGLSSQASRRFRRALSLGIASLTLALVLSPFPGLATEVECAATWSAGMRKLVNALEVIESRHADAKVAEKLIAKVMDHLAREMDPHSNYYDVEAYRELRRNLEGRNSEQASLNYRLLPGTRAYLHIRTFDERAPEQLVKAIEQLDTEASHGLSGVVLDLRDNPGGLVRSAIGVAAAFLPVNSLVIRTHGDGADSEQELRARPDDYLDIDQDDYLAALPSRFKTLPLTVLVNRGSASASEILAAALQDHGRAVIVGTRTYGKGTVQTIIPLPDDTAIKFTTAYFYTPNGRKVDGQGVSPDVVIKRYAQVDKDNASAAPAPAHAVHAALAGACALKGSAEGLPDVNELSGDDMRDCQLQQAMLTLTSERVAKAR